MVVASGGALKRPGDDDRIPPVRRPARADDPAARAGIDALEGEQATIRELSGIAGVSEGVLRGLVNQGVLEPSRSIATGPIRARAPISTCPS